METKSIYKFVITGGPCGGKTEALPYLEKHFSQKGYKVITVAETATELIKNGINPKSFDNISKFQKHCISLQIKKEEIYLSAAKEFSEDVIILFDRGALDGKAYTTNEQFDEILSKINTSEAEILKRYDAVFHLTSTSDGAEKYYTTTNNTARTETLQEARQADLKTLSAWKNHPNHTIINNSTDFNGKINRLISKIEKYINM